MINELKKKMVKNAAGAAIFFAVIGAAIFGFTIKSTLMVLKGHVQFETLAPEEIGGQVVDISMKQNFGAFIEEYEKNTKTGDSRSTALYYIIWSGDDDATDYVYLGIRVPAEYKAKMEQMISDTYELGASDPIEFSGQVKRMDDEEYGYLMDFFTSAGYSEAEAEERTVPYFIYVNSLVGANAVVMCVFTAVGLLLILFAVFKVIYALRGGYLKAMYKEAEAYGRTESEVNWDCEAAVLIDGTQIRVGRCFIYAVSGSKISIIPTNKLVWVYYMRTAYRTNGIKTGTIFNVALVSDDKKRILLPARNEDAARAAVGAISNRIPRAVAGYSEELNKLFNSNLNEFLMLAYNNPEVQMMDMSSSK